MMNTTMLSAIRIGGWVVLQNVHFISPTTLEKNLCALNDEIPAPLENKGLGLTQTKDLYNPQNFRVWITTHKWDACPTTLILRSIRASYQAPIGVRESMLYLFKEHVLPDQIHPTEDRAWGRQLYCLSLYYSIMHHRRNYGASAWSSTFHLDTSDWTTCAEYLKSFVFDHARDSSTNVGHIQMLQNVRYMLSDIFLGARVEDEWDRRILGCLTERIMTEGIFSSDPFELMPGIRMPEENSHKAMKVAICELPTSDSSGVLGLGSNAEQLARLDASQQMITFLTLLSPQHSTLVGDVDMEQVVTVSVCVCGGGGGL